MPQSLDGGAQKASAVGGEVIDQEIRARAASGGYKVYEIKRCCSPCFGAKCLACGEWLTKHDFDPGGACRCAEQALTPGYQWYHLCPKAVHIQLEIS